ncbi:two pore domain potassium channel family protein [Methanofollis formosanus]|uniref:Two pore domain potassium channel family protein n=1 Tax=Methanofollis formosanus TaxID=299308 RepID=A0A8G1A4H2_9EURY|nr:potassium channel family protein [Methanofollis formosanus]QYZ80291.1 two pore domain potassium channel family protein [Methanofollis formosanus]
MHGRWRESLRVRLDGLSAYRFRILLFFLILTLLIIPMAVMYPELNPLFLVFFSMVIITGVFAAQRKRYFLIFIMLLAIPAITARWISYLFPSAAGEITGHLFAILFFSFFAVYLLGIVLRARTITGDTIAGAISVYLIMGLAWAQIYQFMDEIQPGSFAYDSGTGPGGVLSLMDYVYFSFVTITTLGYGDIYPLSPAAESAASFEAVTGTIYIAVLIARLVGSMEW